MGGVYRWFQANYNSFYGDLPGQNQPGSGKIVILGGLIIFGSDTIAIATYYLSKISNSRYLIYDISSGSSSWNLIQIDKTNLPPRAPDKLGAQAQGLDVALTWTDNSDNEKEFLVLRRDSITSEFKDVAKLSAGVSSYSENLDASGVYWYRIKAANDEGESAGSNVVKVSAE